VCRGGLPRGAYLFLAHGEGCGYKSPLGPISENRRLSGIAGGKKTSSLIKSHVLQKVGLFQKGFDKGNPSKKKSETSMENSKN